MWPYNTERWKKLRAAKLALNPVCEACGAHVALECHHSIPLTEHQREYRDERAGFPPPALLRTYCKPCHSRVTCGSSSRELTESRKWDLFLEGK